MNIQVREIVKNPDYQFYHQVMQYRIEKVEQEYVFLLIN
jgi:hypothetical protein